MDNLDHQIDYEPREKNDGLRGLKALIAGAGAMALGVAGGILAETHRRSGFIYAGTVIAPLELLAMLCGLYATVRCAFDIRKGKTHPDFLWFASALAALFWIMIIAWLFNPWSNVPSSGGAPGGF